MCLCSCQLSVCLNSFLPVDWTDPRSNLAHSSGNIPPDNRVRHDGLRILQRSVSTFHLLAISRLNLSSITRSRLCGYNFDLKYPETKKYPLIVTPLGGYWDYMGFPKSQFRYSNLMSTFQSCLRTNLAKGRIHLDKRKRGLAHREWKRDLSTRPNGTIDPWYGCDLFDFVVDYALNFTYPWSNDTALGFDVSYDRRFLLATHSDRICFCPQVYNVPSALDPPSFLDASFFLNGTSTTPTRAMVTEAMCFADPVVKRAIHAPNKTWELSVDYLFGGANQDPSKWSFGSFKFETTR